MMNNQSNEWLALEPEQQTLIARIQRELPVKVGQLAKELGLIVKSATLPVGISGEISPDPESESGFKVRVNRHEAKTRQRFTLAHEIAHFLLHKDQIGDGITDSVLYRSTLSDKREAEANRLAADILMPSEKLQEYLSNAKNADEESIVDSLANSFSVSRPALEIRLGILR